MARRQEFERRKLGKRLTPDEKERLRRGFLSGPGDVKIEKAAPRKGKPTKGK